MDIELSQWIQCVQKLVFDAEIWSNIVGPKFLSKSQK